MRGHISPFSLSHAYWTRTPIWCTPHKHKYIYIYIRVAIMRTFVVNNIKIADARDASISWEICLSPYSSGLRGWCMCVCACLDDHIMGIFVIYYALCGHNNRARWISASRALRVWSIYLCCFSRAYMDSWGRCKMPRGLCVCVLCVATTDASSGSHILL